LLQWGQKSVESLWPMEQDQQATGTAESRTLIMIALLLPTQENDEPQPQECFEFGLIKLNPCRISVSS